MIADVGKDIIPGAEIVFSMLPFKFNTITLESPDGVLKQTVILLLLIPV